MMELTCECVGTDFNCDGLCSICGLFVGEERYQKFWEGEEELAEELGGYHAHRVDP